MAENIDAERAAFEAWARDTNQEYGSLKGSSTSLGWYYFDDDAHTAWEAWQAARRTPSASIGGDGLPELPKDEFCAWLHNGRVANAFTHGVGDRAIWDRDQYWSSKGYDRAPLYTADQMRQYARDAVAVDRRRPKREMPPELRAAIEEAHKTGSTGALLPDGSAIFINYGHDYGDNAHLECTACGGSGHIDDQRLIARQSQGEPVYFYRQRHTGLNWIETDRDPRERFAGTPAELCMEYRTLYAAPPLSSEQQLASLDNRGDDLANSASQLPLSSEQQAEKGESACGS